jgi:hypothetical protein
MSWGVLHAGMLLGLLGVAIPVVIHLLSRRWDPVIDWGAMQFLELGRRARRRFRINDWLLLFVRMLLLAFVVLALARPFGAPRIAVTNVAGGAERRDVVLILDGSASMDRKAGGTTPREQALLWARRFVAQLGPDDSVAVLLAADRVRPLLDPSRLDKRMVESVLAKIPAPRGSSDLASALAVAFRILERTENPTRDVILLTDGQRFAWRPGELNRWALLCELHHRLPSPPRIWSIAFQANAPPEGPNGSLGPLEVSRKLVAPNAPITIATTLTNAGPGPLTRSAELLLDGVPVPGSSQVAGPIPAGGRTPLSFRTAIAEPGMHVLAVHLDPSDDPLPVDDESVQPIEVTPALPVLLVDGEPGVEPLTGATDFLRAALVPAGDETPDVRATVVLTAAFSRGSCKDQRAIVLANVDRLTTDQIAALDDFLGLGGGLLVVPGDRSDANFYNHQLFRTGDGWLPAALGDWKGDFTRRTGVAHPDPRSFNGPALSPFARGDNPPLAAASLFAYRLLTPSRSSSSVTARLDTGDPWIVERPYRQGRVALLAGPIGTKGGTLIINPDFVPWAHELVFHLAAASADSLTIQPGELLVLDLDLPASVDRLSIRRPDGTLARAAVTCSTGRARVRFDDTTTPGLYHVLLPDSPGGSIPILALADARETDLTPLEPAEAARLAESWPLSFVSDPETLTGRWLVAGGSGRREYWRSLVLVVLAGLCLEVWMTRQLARGRGWEGAEP